MKVEQSGQTLAALPGPIPGSVQALPGSVQALPGAVQALPGSVQALPGSVQALPPPRVGPSLNT